jgi:hypothetical protein
LAQSARTRLNRSGRAPGTADEILTTRYLAEQLKNFGLAPGSPDRTYYQKVPEFVRKKSTTSLRATVGVFFDSGQSCKGTPQAQTIWLTDAPLTSSDAE